MPVTVPTACRRLVFAAFVLLLGYGCHSGAGPYDGLPLAMASPPTGCDDSTAFQSPVDLLPLEYLKGCYAYTAIKQVPGLGEAPWVGNCEVYVADSTLQLRFKTYKVYFGEFLPQEILTFDYIAPNVGIHPVYRYDDWAQDPDKGFGAYSRLLDDGDVADGFWETDTTCTNYIEITRLDWATEEVEGKFELHLKMTTQGTHGILYSERINFLTGRFQAEIEN